MKGSFKKSILFVLMVLALLVSAMGATTAYADDGTPPPTTEEVAQPPVDEPAEEDETVVAEEPATKEPEGEETTVAEEPAAEEPEEQETAVVEESVATEEPAESEPAEAEEPTPAEEAPTVAEVIEQLPEDTALVVLDESGEALPLATEDAAEAMAAPDPYFTVGGTLYQFTAADCNPNMAGDQACSTPIQAAIDYLAWLDATPDDNTIYVEAGTYNEDIYIESWWWTDLGDLVLSGAGSGSTIVNGGLEVYSPNSFGLSGFTFQDWVDVDAGSDVNINDVVVDGTNAKGGLYVYSDGDVTLQGVNSYQSSYAGADVYASGNINIKNSHFDDNTFYGLSASSYSGNVTLNGVTANGNGEAGAVANAYNGDALVTNSTFNDNGFVGLEAGFGGFGFASSPASGNLKAAVLSSSGNVTLDGVTANGNGGIGAYAFTLDGDVLIFNSTFNSNGYEGFEVEAFGGSVKLDKVTASGNSELGAYLGSDTVVEVFCSTFSNNGTGVSAGTPGLNLNGVTFFGNEVDFENQGGNVSVSDYPCGGGKDGSKDGGKKPVVLYIIIPQTSDQMPVALAEGNTFVSALKAILTDQGAKLDDLTITLAFQIPAGMKDAELAVMFWNGSAWVEVSGGSVVGDAFVITVNQPGVYVLVSK